MRCRFRTDHYYLALGKRWDLENVIPISRLIDEGGERLETYLLFLSHTETGEAMTLEQGTFEKLEPVDVTDDR